MMQALLAPVGDEWYAMPIDTARELVEAPLATRLPGGPDALLGALNVRGEIVPLIDTGRLLGTEPLAEPRFALVVDTDHGPAALALSGIPDTTTLSSEDAADTSPVRIGDRLVSITDPARLISRLPTK